MIGTIQALAMLGALAPQVQGQPLGKVPVLVLKDILLIISAALALLLLLLLWAKYLRNAKPRKHRTGGQKVVRSVTDEENDSETEEDSPEVRRRFKYRYKRRGHRSRNPTLAETGGLPPARTEEPGKPS